ncbi:MAG: hypothetical protein ABI177_13690 [Edaphobacter sp.]
MEVTVRGMVSVLHGLLFGGFFLMAIFGIGVELCRSAYAKEPSELTALGYSLERLYLIVMAGLGWLAVLSGAYVVYPWYRAALPAGVTNLAGYPQRLLMSSASTIEWHTLGMEWKEHVAWFAPIAMTMVAYVMVKYRGSLRHHAGVRRAMVAFAVAALLAGGIAGCFGALIDKAAPVEGGGTVRMMGGAR